MRRIWLVDDRIPIQSLYGGPFPSRLEREMVQHLVDQLPQAAWEEPAVLDLCRTLCGQDYEPTFFTSPEGMLRALDQGAVAPHAVVFDWEYPGSNNARNLQALDRLLGSSFAYVQIYTHLGEEGVEPLLPDLRAKYRGRLLPTKTKATVTATQLSEQVKQAWVGTIAGELADQVRAQVAGAVERTLIDICEIGRGTIAAMSQGEAENFIHVVLSKVRDEVGMRGAEALDAIVSASQDGQPSDELRRLMSIWYYAFPSDQRVRRGDLIEIDGELGFVVTPPCDLVRFHKKTGRRLTWLKMVRLDQPGIGTMRQLGLKVNTVGNSIVADHGEAGEAIVLLPNVPLVVKSRQEIADFVLLCHAWESRVFPEAPQGEITYADLPGVSRRCTLADPFASAVVARVSSVISSPGTPDLPRGELVRLRLLTAPPAPAPKGAPPAQAAQ
jgi:hypothetical protein